MIIIRQYNNNWGETEEGRNEMDGAEIDFPHSTGNDRRSNQYHVGFSVMVAYPGVKMFIIALFTGVHRRLVTVFDATLCSCTRGACFFGTWMNLELDPANMHNMFVLLVSFRRILEKKKWNQFDTF